MRLDIPRIRLRINRRAETVRRAPERVAVPVARSQRIRRQCVNIAANIVANNSVCHGIWRPICVCTPEKNVRNPKFQYFFSCLVIILTNCFSLIAFACRLCVAMFKQKAHLLKHLCSVHRNMISTPEANGRFSCCFCSMWFDTLQELVRHLSGHHNNMLLSKNLTLRDWCRMNGRQEEWKKEREEPILTNHHHLQSAQQKRGRNEITMTQKERRKNK